MVYNKVKDQTTEDRIILYGRSLGTGIASYLASKNNPKQLILETPYYSILDVAKSRFPVFPVKRLLINQFPTFKYLPKINNSVTILHGTDDSLVPYSSGKKLDELALKNVNFVT
ncbi:MAG: alpha/beta hydrolase, partial [Winogradskyella sp.]|nr:alpha/beta hydrolase [Winogradskyella sp.]